MLCLHNMVIITAVSRHGSNKKPVRSILLCYYYKHDIPDICCDNAVALLTTALVVLKALLVSMFCMCLCLCLCCQLT